MIKITNLNFQNQTIENIEVDCESVDNLEIKLTKTKFNIVIVKKGEVIKKEIKKKDIPEKMVDLVMEDIKEEINEDPVVEELVEDIKEKNEVVMDEPVVEQVVEEQVEQPVMELITLAKIKDLLKQHIPKKNTLDSYCRTIQQVHDYFEIEDVHELLNTKQQDIIDHLEKTYTKSISTVKSKLCAIYKVYKILNIESELFRNRIEHYAYQQKTKQDENKELNKKTTQEGDAIIDYFENKLNELGEKVQNDTDLLNNWKPEVQLYCILKIYLRYGVLRPSEFLDCKITDTECEDNHINVSTKQIVIHHHKNDRKGTKTIDISEDKKLVGILRKGLNRYIITNQNDELYQSSSAFTKMFKSQFNDYTPYDLRKAISSNCIAEGNVDEIKKLENHQGHTLQVILDNYNIYTKSS